MTSTQRDHSESAKGYRAKAEECAERVRTTRSLKQGSEARKSQKAYLTLAENEEWLAGHADKLA